MLKTLCDKCLFYGAWPPYTPKDCLLHKITYNVDGITFCQGFCRYKRDESWKYSKDDKNRQEILDMENSFIDLVIIDNGNLDDLSKLLNNTLLSYPQIKKTILILTQANIKYYEKCTIMLQTYGGEWSIENLLIDEIKEDRDKLDYAAPNLKSTWFICLKSCEDFSYHQINSIMKRVTDLLKDKDRNMVGMTYDSESVLGNVINRAAFLELQGNSEVLFIDKIKQMDDEWVNYLPAI